MVRTDGLGENFGATSFNVPKSEFRVCPKMHIGSVSLFHCFTQVAGLVQQKIMRTPAPKYPSPPAQAFLQQLRSRNFHSRVGPWQTLFVNWCGCVMAEHVPGLPQHPKYPKFIKLFNWAGFKLQWAKTSDVSVVSPVHRSRWIAMFIRIEDPLVQPYDQLQSSHQLAEDSSNPHPCNHQKPDIISHPQTYDSSTMPICIAMFNPVASSDLHGTPLWCQPLGGPARPLPSPPGEKHISEMGNAELQEFFALKP